MITTQQLTKKFGDCTAVNAVSTEMHEGAVFGLIGSNGAGKSTFLRMLAGVLKPDGGTLSIDGEEVWGIRGSRAGASLSPTSCTFSKTTRAKP